MLGTGRAQRSASTGWSGRKGASRGQRVVVGAQSAGSGLCRWRRITAHGRTWRWPRSFAFSYRDARRKSGGQCRREWPPLALTFQEVELVAGALNGGRNPASPKCAQPVTAQNSRAEHDLRRC